MKSILIIISAVLLICSGTNAQMRMRGDSQAMKKIDELEKVKIIDALNLDEQTTLKFFARRSEFRDKQDKLFIKASKLLDKMDDAAKKDDDKKDSDFKKMINQYLSINEEIIKQRNDFFNSLSNILTERQIAQLLVFERKFREEIRDVLFKERMHRP